MSNTMRFKARIKNLAMKNLPSIWMLPSNKKALSATTEKRMSTASLENKDKILTEIQSDKVMRQRWDRYCKENYYANGIGVDGVMEEIKELLN